MLKNIKPTFKPSVENPADTSNFEYVHLPSLLSFVEVLMMWGSAEFTSEAPMDSVVEDSHLSETVQAQFNGFSYVQPNGGFGESVR